MLPLLPFIAGIATGAVAIKLWRSDKSKLKFDQAQEALRHATVSSLEAIEHSSASMRKRLSAPAAAAPAPRKARKPAVKKAPGKKPVAAKTEMPS